MRYKFIEQLKPYLHDFKYIYWERDDDVIRKVVSINQFKTKYNLLLNEGKLVEHKTKRDEYKDNNSYFYDEKCNYRHLYCREDDKYVHYVSHRYKDDLNKLRQLGKRPKNGSKAKKMWSKLFKEEYGITEKTAFGYCDRPVIHKCVPKAVYYINNAYNNSLIHHVSKGDYSSNYPANIMGDLPDWHTRIQCNGTVAPTEEYPFAYYIKSGHLAEYNRFDTHNWVYHDTYSMYLLRAPSKKDPVAFDPKVKRDNDITILCKKSNYRFDNVVKRLYRDKCAEVMYDETFSAKQALNCCIGFMHRSDLSNDSYRLDHIAAIVIGRANDAMLKNWMTLSYLHIDVLQVVVDGIIYKSDKIIGVPEEEKYIGALVQEVHDADFIMRGQNAYMFFKDGQLIQVKHGAYDEDIETNKPEDIFKWKKKEITNE